MELNLRPDGCLPSCTLYRHDSLCPVIHSAEQIEISLLILGYTRLTSLLTEKSAELGAVWEEVDKTISSVIDGSIHKQAVALKNEALAKIAEGKKTERAKTNLTCSSCGIMSCVDLSVAIRGDQFIRCNTCDEKVKSDKHISSGSHS